MVISFLNLDKNMKKTYISPETMVFVCKTNSLLMSSTTLDVLDDNPIITPTDEEFDGEFSSRDMEFEEDDLDY